MLLQIVALAGDVRAHLHPVRQPDARDLAESRVRLLRRGRVHARAHTPLLRGAAKGRGLHLRLGRGATLAHELIYGWHTVLTSSRRGLRHNKGWPRACAPANRGCMVANR